MKFVNDAEFLLLYNSYSLENLYLPYHLYPEVDLQNFNEDECLTEFRFKKAIQYRKWSPTANDPDTANDPQNGLQMILDRKWSPKSTANDPERKIGMTWTQVGGSSCRFYYYYQNVRLKAKFYFSNKSMNKN